MAIRYYFKDGVSAMCAVSDIHNLGFWAVTFKSGLPDGAVLGVECSPLAEGLVESRYYAFLVH